MARVTIDFGIDLGTTNSTIAVLRGTEVEVFKNNEGFEYTPSVVYIDKQGRLWVGRQAKEHLDSDPHNAFAEFKLQMGTTQTYRFVRSGREMKPEDLSAEVLKSLKGDVQQLSGEQVQAAVITVPAAFELPQCKATEKAANMAGIMQSPLLQEPVAAAIAYGFQSTSDKVFWLVYDFGGGTFDAAVIQVRDGIIQVVNHGGDNHLGGKLIDWAIVEELLIPALTRERRLSDFRRGNSKWAGAIAKLKLKAEEAKIRVSRSETATISIEALCQDDRGEMVEFEYELQKQDVERLAEPLILRSINICKKVLTEKRLGVTNIEKILLVGGPTLMPYLRERLSDPHQGLGIPLDFSIDPLTVVARGAAFFAGTQRMTVDQGILRAKRDEGLFTVSFPEWKFTGSDAEPMVAGIVQAPAGNNLQGFAIEFINTDARPQWRSGKVGLGPNGAFMLSLWAEKGHPNKYKVELSDATGRLVETVTDPETLTYTIGMVITNPPLTHSIGVELINNEVLWFLEKGTPLPARKREVLRTAYEMRRGQVGDVIRIPVIEGEKERANRNKRIGKLEVKPHQVKRDVPVGSEVEFTIDINESRLITTKAYIPILDEEFEEVMQIGEEKRPEPRELKKLLESALKRLEELRKSAQETGATQAQQALQRIDAERMVHEVQTWLDAAQTDPDAADKCEKRLRDLEDAMDQVEEALEWPGLVAEAEKLISAGKEIIQEHGDLDDKNSFRRHENEVRQAIQANDPDLLMQRIQEMRGAVMRVLDRKGILQAIFFQQLCEKVSEMRDQAQATQLIAQGQRAINANDVETLRNVNRQLAALLPVPIPQPDETTVTRGR